MVFLKKPLFRYNTYASLTRVLNKIELEAISNPGDFGVIPAHSFGTTVRKTRDNRIFLRNLYAYGVGFKSTLSDIEHARKKHQLAFDRRYPQISSMGYETSWGGMMAISYNGGMVFGKLADRVYGTAFCNGTGVSRGTTFGKAIAEYAMGQDSRAIQILNKRARPMKRYNDFITRIGVKLTTSYRFFEAGKEN